MRRSAWQRTITDANGVPVSGVQINVFLNDGITPATIASSAAGAALTNPFVTSTAVAKFFAMPGLYVVKATKDGQTQTFSDVEIGARNYRDDQGALGGTAVIVDNITNDATIVSEGGSFRFTAAATGKPSFVNSGQVWSAPHDGTPFSFMLGVGLRANSSRAAFIGSRGGVGQAPAWVELWDKTTSPAQAGSLADATAGALLTPGSFGWGGVTTPPTLSPIGATVDTIGIPSGVYRVVAADAGLKPFGLTDYTMADFKYGSTAGSRIAFGVGGEIYSIGYSGGVFNANGWRRQIDTQNAITPIVWDGARNTGGLMEYGINSNGVYYKYADGRLECIFARNVSLSANTDDAYTWTFPAAFVNPPNQITTAIGGASVTNIFNVNKAVITSSGLTSAVMRTQVSVAQSHTLSYCAVGRWR